MYQEILDYLIYTLLNIEQIINDNDQLVHVLLAKQKSIIKALLLNSNLPKMFCNHNESRYLESTIYKYRIHRNISNHDYERIIRRELKILRILPD
jgi:hypothetical protein